jgi:type IV pilus assembly protein PilF
MWHRRIWLLVALVVPALGLVACAHNNGIIKYPTPMTNLKNAPHDTAKQDQHAAAQTHTQLATAYIKRGHLKEAQAALQKALQFDAKYIPAHTMLAILDWHIDRLDEADAEFRAAVALDPSNGDTNNNYGKFLCARGKTKQAMGYFKRALADPFYKTPALAETNAGECLLKSGDLTGAERYLREALKIDANFDPALLAMAQLDYRKGKAFDARGYLQRFQGAGQATPESLLLGYRIATHLGDKETATNYSNRLQDQFPDSSQAQSLHGSRNE